MVFIRSSQKFLSSLLNHRFFLPSCFMLAFIIRIIYIMFITTIPDVADSKWYYDRALSIINGNGVATDGKLTAYWPVGYAFFLAGLFKVFGTSVFLAKLANIIMYLLSMFFVYKIAKISFNQESIARASILVMALYPNHIAYSAELMSEILFTFLFLAGIYRLISFKQTVTNIIISGMIFGAATLVKSQVLFIPGLLLICIFFPLYKEQKRRFFTSIIKYGFICYAGLFLVVAPWTYRNYVVFDTFILVNSNGGFNLYLGHSPEVKTQFGLPLAPPEVLNSYGQQVAQDEIAADNAMREVAISAIKQNPFASIKQIPHKIKDMWLMDVDGGRLNEREMFNIGDATKRFFYYFKIGSQAYYILILLGFAGFLWSMLRKKFALQSIQLIGLISISYFTIISMVFHGESRYHFPLMPLVIFNACAGIFYLLFPKANSQTSPEQQV
ncbi:ArnT family glycosyltransferase [Herpetosiphon sp. NSE202]|uniref:ArnT family glycosyltransferase n=1 Tax=Herpetosiphon sp. NSE202 TaxID=3351349 RepID=UPI003641E525